MQDISQSTQTGFKTLENMHKPLVMKELKKIWEKDDPNFPWEKGYYNESNTLLLDDSPYKALLNPVSFSPLVFYQVFLVSLFLLVKVYSLILSSWFVLVLAAHCNISVFIPLQGQKWQFSRWGSFPLMRVAFLLLYSVLSLSLTREASLISLESGQTSRVENR